MDQNTIFRRTTDGDKLLDQGTSDELPRALRQVLALINGRRSVRSIDEQLLSQYDVVNILQTLLERRLITDTVPSVSKPADVPSASESESVSIDLDAVRSRYVDLIGPIGGVMFEQIVDDLGDVVTTPDGYRQLIEQLSEHIEDEAENQRFRKQLL